MAYCDYDFYTTKYLGNVIAEADFPRLAQRASDKIDVLTFDRLVDNFPTDTRIADKVKKAVCAIAEQMVEAENTSRLLREQGGSVVSSVSSGSESVTFRQDAGSSASKRELENSYRQTAVDYLIGTGLLYAGID